MIKARWRRTKGAAKAGAGFVLAGFPFAGGVAGLGRLLDSENGIRANAEVSPLLLTLVGGVGVLVLGGAGVHAYRASSEANRRYLNLHGELGERIHKGKIFADGVANAAEREKELKNKFKYWLIDRDGQLYFTDRNYFLGVIGRERGKTRLT